MKIAVLGRNKQLTDLGKLFNQNVEISFFLDNNTNLSGTWIGDKKIYSPYDFPKGEVDYIVVFLMEYEAVNQEFIDLGIDRKQIINFNSSDLEIFEHGDIFDLDEAEKYRLKLKIEYLERRMKQFEKNQQFFEESYMYEIAAKLNKGELTLPIISSVEDTYKKIIMDKCSVSRYGDGEFEMILGHGIVYQNADEKLAERLQDILCSDLDNHIVAIADDYGGMEGIRKENRNTIRRYMTEEKRMEHYRLLDMDRKYYNAYISRPYVIYPHNQTEAARKRFEDLKQIWNDQDILFVEGEKTRMGVGNDLFHNARSVTRVIAPSENAFTVYDEIYHAALQYGPNKLILIALGPTATVLAYDLAKAGYWALDIGHLDLEYEWFLKGKGYSYILHKYNNEMPGDTNIQDIYDEDYEKSILKTIR
ncbi:MAG: DUF1792 domain-containing protein [Hungatella sp.]|nr:DUF1792 domain-containing protein [Hungatella sp.]